MKIISCRQTIRVPAERGRAVLDLAAGVPYVMHDVEADSGQRAGAFASLDELPAAPPRWHPGLPAGRVVLPFIGGLGDAVSMLGVLASVARNGTRVTVATTPGPAGIFELSPAVDTIVPYPLTREQWCSFDAHLTMEAVYEARCAPGDPLCSTFASAMGVPLDPSLPALNAPSCTDNDHAGQRVIGVAVGDGPTLRAFPALMLTALVRRLVEQGSRCILLGHADPAWSEPATVPGVVDLRSRTSSIGSLVEEIARIDAMIAHDSLLMHLAGAMGVPTVGLFAPTSARHAEPYAHALPILSRATCAPCHAAGDECPQGHDRCVAWDEIDIESIVDAVDHLFPAPAALNATG